jgi:type IV pilus assembly protein PilA
MLARIRKTMEEREDGFTLIELLVVIIIIGILAAIAIPVFLNQRQKGYDAQAKSDARNAATMEESYLTDYNAYIATADPGTDLASQGFKKSGNVTSVTIYTYDATGGNKATTGSANSGSYCIDALSASSKHFYYNSKTGGLTTTACS